MAMCWTFYLMFDALIFDSWLLQSEMQKPRSLMNERGFFLRKFELKKELNAPQQHRFVQLYNEKKLP